MLAIARIAANADSPEHRRSGFTLVELMVVLAIATILLGMAVPGFRTLIDNQRMNAAVNDLYGAVTLARSEAIERGRRVDLVPADGTSWANGWIVFIDGNNNQQLDPGELLLYSHEAVGTGISISAAMTDASVQYVAYVGSGRTRTNANSQTPQVGSWSFFQHGQVKRRIKLGFLGRPRSCDPVTDVTCS